MIYEKVKAYCDKHKMPISEFERLCGLKNGAVSKWKDGKSHPTLTTLQKIANGTKTSIRTWVG